jgi:AMP nucleosidase
MQTKKDICQNWLPRYTGIKIQELADYILLTNFQGYVSRFAEITGTKVMGLDRAMPNATCSRSNVSIINFGMGSANAATIMDLLSARMPKAVLFLGKCGGLKHSTEIGHFILPTAAIRGEGTSNDYFPPEVPAMPSFKLHKFVSQKIVDAGFDYRTGVVYTTNRRVWEHDKEFLKRLQKMKCIAIDMETATVLMVGLYNEIARGALLVVSDVPITPEGVKTEAGDKNVSAKWTDIHLKLGIESMKDLESKGEQIKHFKY